MFCCPLKALLDLLQLVFVLVHVGRNEELTSCEVLFESVFLESFVAIVIR